MSDTKISNRLKEIRRYFNLNQTEFANSLGISQPAWSKLEKGENIMSVNTLQKITIRYKASADWIINGEGRMLLSDTESPVPKEKLTQIMAENNHLRKKVSDLESKNQQLSDENYNLTRDNDKLTGENKGLLSAMNLFLKMKDSAQ